MKAKLMLLLMAATFTFSSCKRCCKIDGGSKICKGDYTQEEWDEVVENCEALQNCECGV